mmetsp:Transcript_19343/g.37929  ORF Transcript_19343/g.37929 Transcript_19343/m.37929 type:complete len:481 (-) Transcript_19343:69-1511(-)
MTHLHDLVLSEGKDLKAEFAEFLVGKNVTAIKDEGRLLHGLVKLLKIKLLELFPLGKDHNGVGISSSRVGILGTGDLLIHALLVALCVKKLTLHIVSKNLRVVHSEVGALLKEEAAHVSRSGLAGVTGVSLKGEAKDGNLLASHSVKHTLDNGLGKSLLLEFVHLHNPVPVLGNIVETKRLAQVNQVENILLEAAATKANTALEEVLANTVISSNSTGNLINVSAAHLTESRDRVDGTHTLRKKSVGNELGQLRGPQVSGDDTLTRDPVLVDLHKALDSCKTLRGLLTANEHAARLKEILNSGTFGKKLGGADNLVLDALLVCSENAAHALCSANGYGGLLYNNLGRSSDLGDVTCHELTVRDVSSTSSTDTASLGRRVDTDKDNVGLCNGTINVGGEEEVLVAALEDELIETRFVDREFVRVPGSNLLLADIHNGHSDVVALVGDHRHGGATNIAGTNAHNVHAFALAHYCSCSFLLLY